MFLSEILVQTRVQVTDMGVFLGIILGCLVGFFVNKLGDVKFGTIPCQVDTYKNENTVFLIRPNRGNIPPRFGHFF